MNEHGRLWASTALLAVSLAACSGTPEVNHSTLNATPTLPEHTPTPDGYHSLDTHVYLQPDYLGACTGNNQFTGSVSVNLARIVVSAARSGFTKDSAFVKAIIAGATTPLALETTCVELAMVDHIGVNPDKSNFDILNDMGQAVLESQSVNSTKKISWDAYMQALMMAIDVTNPQEFQNGPSHTLEAIRNALVHLQKYQLTDQEEIRLLAAFNIGANRYTLQEEAIAAATAYLKSFPEAHALSPTPTPNPTEVAYNDTLTAGIALYNQRVQSGDVLLGSRLSVAEAAEIHDTFFNTSIPAITDIMNTTCPNLSPTASSNTHFVYQKVVDHLQGSQNTGIVHELNGITTQVTRYDDVCGITEASMEAMRACMEDAWGPNQLQPSQTIASSSALIHSTLQAPFSKTSRKSQEEVRDALIWSAKQKCAPIQARSRR